MSRALVVTRGAEPVATLAEVPDAEPGPGDVVIDVAYSSLNYKDALALAGRPGIVRADRLVAGIDLVGTVSRSESPDWATGDRVLVNGCGLGETHDGGLAERAVVPADWLVRVPAPLDLRRAAAIGTAGLTAQLAILELERRGATGEGATGEGATGEVVVSGASGGVGSLAVALLARGGVAVTALTGKPARHAVLRELGARTVLDPSELAAAGKPLESQRWTGAVDTVGGAVLAGILARMSYGGTVAACGNAASVELAGTVLPFILRAVALVGINSVFAPAERRAEAWERIAGGLELGLLDRLTSVVGLAQAPEAARALIDGVHAGRTVVDVRA